METRGRGDLLADLIVRSASALAALVRTVSRLPGGSFDDGVLTEVSRLSGGGTLSADAARQLFPAYLEGVERLTRHIDRWVAA
jgi:hypothetical protein